MYVCKKCFLYLRFSYIHIYTFKKFNYLVVHTYFFFKRNICYCKDIKCFHTYKLHNILYNI